MPHGRFNKYRAAIEILQRRREFLVEELADEIVDQSDEIGCDTYTFNEFVETQGTRLHFLGLMISQLEQSADSFEEADAPRAAPKAPARRRRAPAKKMQEASKERSSEDA